MHHHVQGTAVEARLRVRSFFDDLRETVNRQEEAGLAVVDNYVREKLFSLRQQQEDMAVLISQVTSVCLECEKSLQRTDAEVTNDDLFPPFHHDQVMIISSCFRSSKPEITSIVY